MLVCTGSSADSRGATTGIGRQAGRQLAIVVWHAGSRKRVPYHLLCLCRHGAPFRGHQSGARPLSSPPTWASASSGDAAAARMLRASCSTCATLASELRAPPSRADRSGAAWRPARTSCTAAAAGCSSAARRAASSSGAAQARGMRNAHRCSPSRSGWLTSCRQGRPRVGRIRRGNQTGYAADAGRSCPVCNAPAQKSVSQKFTKISPAAAPPSRPWRQNSRRTPPASAPPPPGGETQPPAATRPPPSPARHRR